MGEKIFNALLGQYGALALAIVVLYWMSAQYKETLDLMMNRCEEDRQVYHQQMEIIVQKLEAIHGELKDNGQ